MIGIKNLLYPHYVGILQPGGQEGCNVLHDAVGGVAVPAAEVRQSDLERTPDREDKVVCFEYTGGDEDKAKIVQNCQQAPDPGVRAHQSAIW